MTSERALDARDTCDESCAHPGAVARARLAMPGGELIFGLAELFKTLGDPTRVRVLMALSSGELCVCDLAEVLGASPSAVSHQLRVLRAARLVRYRREGKNAYYTLDDDHVRELFAMAQEHVAEDRTT